MSDIKFQKIIRAWFAKNGRYDLPWRPPTLKLRRDGTADPYKIFVSEVMLQQTQAERVKEYYEKFLRAFPTVRKLAEASPAEVLRAWKGLGYNRRALYLKRAAEMIMRDYRGKFPRTVAEIEKLPGVGSYTARALVVFAFNQPVVLIETNIRRVFIHFFGDVILAKDRIQPKNNLSMDSHLRGNDTHGTIADKDLIPIIHSALYKKNPRMWYNALMDYGALALGGITNPNRRSRHYIKQSRFEGSRRYARAKILDFLLKNICTSQKTLSGYFQTDQFLKPYAKSIRDILNELYKEGFLMQKKGRWFLSTK